MTKDFPMWFTSVVLKNVWRRKIRSFLTCASLAIAVCAVVAMLGTAEGYEEAFGQLFEERGADIVVVRANLAQRILSSLDEKLAERLWAIPGVQKVEPILVDMVAFERAQIVAVYVFGLRPDSIALSQLQLTSGRGLREGDRRKVVLGTMLAAELGKKVGDSVEIEGGAFEIVGIFHSYNMLETKGASVLLSDLQELMGRPRQVTLFFLVLENNDPAAVARACRDIDKIQEFNGAPLRLSAQSTRDHVKSTLEIQVLKGLAWASSTLALIVGLVSVLNTMM